MATRHTYLCEQAVLAGQAWLHHRDTESVQRASELLEELEAFLSGELRHFNPEHPAIATVYEVHSSFAFEAACWIFLRHVTGRAHELPEIGRCFAVLLETKSTQQALRDAIKNALMPWLLADAAPVPASEPSAAYGVFKLSGLRLELAQAIVDVAGTRAKLKVVEAKQAIEAYLKQTGWRLVRKSYLHAELELKLQLKSKVVLILEGGPGKWSKVQGTRNRQILITELGSQLRNAAQARLKRGE